MRQHLDALRWYIVSALSDPGVRLVVLATGIVAIVGIVGLLDGCGSAASQHRALNAVSDAVNPSYTLAIEACDEAEQVIIARTGTTYDSDVIAIASIRSVCDRVFGAFDALRLAHRIARAAVDDGGEALAIAWAHLHEAWDALRRVLPEVTRLIDG